MYQSQHNGTSVTNRDYTPVLSTWNQTPAADQLEMNVRFTSLYNGNIAMMSTNMLYLQEAQNIVASQPVELGGLQKSHMVNYYKYDQLQRITRMQSTFPQSGDVSLDAYYEAYQYDFNGNIRSLTRNNSLGTTIDALAYKYQTLANNPSQLVSNRLLDVADASMNAAGFKGNKAALNTANQYEYDADGNLTHDAIEGITITWNATGKVSSVTKTDGTYMQFTYDGMGNRISKLVKPAGITKAGYELYVRDAGGNILASYRGELDTYTPHTTVDNAVVQLETHYIYGSNRIGQNKNTTNTMLNRANIHYELTNHLGNVLVVVTANKLEIAGGNYIPEIVSTTDYTPFGMQMEGRSWNSSEYKFGFNGKEKETEFNEGVYDFGARMYDGRLGRWMSVDPLAFKYPDFSPYVFVKNSPLFFKDPNGKHNVVYLIDLQPEGKEVVNAEDVKQLSETYFKSLGLETKVVIVKPNEISTFNMSYIDQTDAVVVLGDVESVKSYAKNSLKINDGTQKILEPGGKSSWDPTNNPEETLSRKQLILISTTGLKNNANKLRSSMLSVAAFTLVHGFGHTSKKMPEHSDNANSFMADGLIQYNFGVLKQGKISDIFSMENFKNNKDDVKLINDAIDKYAPVDETSKSSSDNYECNKNRKKP